MKKMRFFLCVVLSAAALWSCGGDGDGEPGPEPPVPPVVDPNAVEVVNSGFEKGLEGWTRVDFHNGGKVTVEVVEGAGVNDSRCIKIQQFPENGRCGVGIKQKLTGLEPDQMYRMYAKVKYSDIPQDEGRGAILFDMSQKQFWGASKFLYGTNLRNCSISTSFRRTTGLPRSSARWGSVTAGRPTAAIRPARPTSTT